MVKKRGQRWKSVDLENMYLSEERTLYSKERTVLNIIGVLVTVAGLGFALMKFFVDSWLEIVGILLVLTSTAASLFVTYKFWKLDLFVKKVEDANKKYFVRLKRRALRKR